jgi:hypothetical protein
MVVRRGELPSGQGEVAQLERELTRGEGGASFESIKRGSPMRKEEMVQDDRSE